MFLITLKNQPKKRAFFVMDESGNRIIYMFKEFDDALRFSIQLENNEFPETTIIEFDDQNIIRTCELTNTKYVIIDSENLVVPPVIGK